MSKIKEESIISASKSVAWKKMGEETMLLHLVSGDYLGLNATGDKLWKLADGRKTLKQIVAQATKAFGVSAETVKKDSLDFFEVLHKFKMIDVS